MGENLPSDQFRPRVIHRFTPGSTAYVLLLGKLGVPLPDWVKKVYVVSTGAFRIAHYEADGAARAAVTEYEDFPTGGSTVVIRRDGLSILISADAELEVVYEAQGPVGGRPSEAAASGPVWHDLDDLLVMPVSPADGATGYTWVDGGAGNDRIQRTDGGSFITDLWTTDHRIWAQSAKTAGNNGGYDILAVTAEFIDIPTGSITADTLDTTVAFSRAPDHDPNAFFNANVVVDDNGFGADIDNIVVTSDFLDGASWDVGVLADLIPEWRNDGTQLLMLQAEWTADSPGGGSIYSFLGISNSIITAASRGIVCIRQTGSRGGASVQNGDQFSSIQSTDAQPHPFQIIPSRSAPAGTPFQVGGGGVVGSGTGITAQATGLQIINLRLVAGFYSLNGANNGPYTVQCLWRIAAVDRFAPGLGP